MPNMSFFDTVFHLLDEQTVLQASALALSASMTTIFRFVQRVYEHRADAVVNVPVHAIDEEFLLKLRDEPNKSMPYVALNGVVGVLEKPLKSHLKTGTEGVASLRTTSEVREKYMNFTWQNEDIIVQSMLEYVPFYITALPDTAAPAALFGKNAAESPRVVVENPIESDWFDETLEVIHEEFTPKDMNTFFESVLSLTNGERLCGYNETEKMLKVGAKLLTIGEVVLEDGVVKVRAPVKTIFDFVVSRKTKSEIVSHMRRSSVVWRICSIMTCGVTVVAGYYFVRRLRMRYVELSAKRRRQLDMDAIRQSRRELRDQDDDERTERSLCVVCLTNPREAVLLDCGHVCLCADCLQQLNQPISCPVCRERVVRCLPLFNV